MCEKKQIPKQRSHDFAHGFARRNPKHQTIDERGSSEESCCLGSPTSQYGPLWWPMFEQFTTLWRWDALENAKSHPSIVCPHWVPEDRQGQALYASPPAGDVEAIQSNNTAFAALKTDGTVVAWGQASLLAPRMPAFSGGAVGEARVLSKRVVSFEEKRVSCTPLWQSWRPKILN